MHYCTYELLSGLMADGDLMGLGIRNIENVQDRVVGINLLHRDQLKPDVLWSVLGKVIQMNPRFALTDRLEVYLDHVRLPLGNGNDGVKTNGRSLDVLSAIKKSTVNVNEVVKCLAYTLIITIARVNGDLKYASHRDGYGLSKPDKLLKACGVDLFNGGV
jgi:hypothetical protein